MLAQEKADWIRELEEDPVLKDIRKREVEEIVGEASKISYTEGVEHGQELGIKKGLEQGRIEGLEERRKLLQKIIAQLIAAGFSKQEIQSMLNIESKDF